MDLFLKRPQEEPLPLVNELPARRKGIPPAPLPLPTRGRGAETPCLSDQTVDVPPAVSGFKHDVCMQELQGG
ncbi:hypothetical protein APZ00_11605 [Pannonibacter phragmitetus]|uniref:Uncharacterized protein n=1 Tax=Pannonibacter phragmitetus TaxID=121719 RepID=A0A0U3ENA3_9HYPH|nr:hypothetical protein APZ00_11605 [Pannonibacter phragmitetus]